MTHPFDTATAAIASGLSRRHVLRAVMASVAGGMSVPSLQAKEFDGTIGNGLPEAASTETNKSLELKVFINPKSKSVTKLYLRDRLPARLTAPGQKTMAVVPQFLNGLGGIELSLFEHSSMTFAKRLSITLGAKPVRVDIPELPGVTFAASRFVRLLAEPKGDDCCVSCCNGYNICAAGVCCSESNPSCGHCCDYGSCGKACDCCAS
jgi:hypothetical protein